MIKIKKVDSLKSEREIMQYSGLKKGDAFIMFDDGRLRIKTDEGHVALFNFCQYSGDEFTGQDVTPVDAEINWAYKD